MTDAPIDRAALSDAELRETLDLLSTVVASVSDRVDGQGQALDRLTKTTAETRQAAFAAYKATDWEQSGAIIEGRIDRATGNALRKLQTVASLIETGRKAMRASSDLMDMQKAEYGRLQREKINVRYWCAAGCLLGLFLGVFLALRLMAFIAVSEPGCDVANGRWITPDSGASACAFLVDP